MPENLTVVFVIFGGQMLLFLPGSVLVVHRALQTRDERSTWEEGKLWLGVVLIFCAIEISIYFHMSRLLEEDLLDGVVATGVLPTWGWALLVQGVLFGLVSGVVAWYRNRSRGTWFMAGVLFGPFGLVATMATAQGEKETTEPESGGSGLCPNCGAHVEWGHGFCSECGHGFDRGEDQKEGIPVYTSEGKVAELTGFGRVLVLLLLTAFAAGLFWGYYYLARMGVDVYLWCAFLAAALSIGAVGGWYELFAGSVDWGCGPSFLLVMGVFAVLAVAPIWFHLTEAPRVSVQGTTARVERTVPPVCMQVDGFLRLTGRGTLERMADALGRAVYDVASGQNKDPERIVVRLTIPCIDPSKPSSDFVARDTVRDAADVRAYANASAYIASDSWRSLSRPQFVPEAPCNGSAFGLIDGFLSR